MGSALLRGDLRAAFAFNPLALISVAVLAALTGLWGMAAGGGPRVRPPRALAAWARRVGATRWLVIGLVVATGYAVLRNLR
jgi:hypothetical protein